MGLAVLAGHGAGSDVDSDYDAVFTETVALTDRVDDAVEELIQARRTGLDQALRGVPPVWGEFSPPMG